MVLPNVTARVEALREAYQNCPMMAHRLGYGREQRQWLLFRRGWNLHPETDNKILRRAYADAYLVAHMEPVFTEGELIVGQPDFSPLSAEEEEELYRPTVDPILVDDCIAIGKSINEGGAVYNQIQPDFLGIFNVVDSLAAVELLVFREKSPTLAELNRILADNFAGNEALRQRINNSLPHFGNNEPMTNCLARQITEMIVDCCKPLSTFRGSTVVPSAFSYNEHIRHGSQTGASPDGRLAGEPLCDGTNPVQGHDTEGPTSMLLSTVSWNQAPFLGGIAVNLELTDSQAKPEVIRSLVDAYITNGGMEIQINVVDKAVLEDAKIHPDKHRNLVVRIGGYSDYFTRLSPTLQDEIIRRNRH